MILHSYLLSRGIISGVQILLTGCKFQSWGALYQSWPRMPVSDLVQSEFCGTAVWGCLLLPHYSLPNLCLYEKVGRFRTYAAVLRTWWSNDLPSAWCTAQKTDAGKWRRVLRLLHNRGQRVTFRLRNFVASLKPHFRKWYAALLFLKNFYFGTKSYLWHEMSNRGHERVNNWHERSG